MPAPFSLKKLILSLIFSLLFFDKESFSQKLSIINTENFSTVLENKINSEDISDDVISIYKSSINIWKNKLNDREKELIIAIINSLNYNNNFEFNYFLKYFNLVHIAMPAVRDPCCIGKERKARFAHGFAHGFAHDLPMICP